MACGIVLHHRIRTSSLGIADFLWKKGRRSKQDEKIAIVSEGDNYAAGNVGALADLGSYTYFHAKLNAQISGKLFIGERLKTSGAEVSFQIMPPRTDIPFYHKHTNNEEIYVFLKGKGQFQVDDVIFNVEEGSVIKILPEGKRSWRNNSDEALIFMVIQATSKSLKSYGSNDGYGVSGSVQWNKDS
ncbi:MAG: cupin domain-containing protein [Lentisphaeria bacterium]|jgi:mannose-6-phosphate isomerase-like protein (cupin superfamily)|nr:cupin domain-containing protein [Lentisphaeria bacterium]